MTSQIDINCRHYGDRELGTARPVDINDHQKSTERHRQRARSLIIVVLHQISMVRKVYRKCRKQTLPLGYLEYIMDLNGGRHDCSYEGSWRIPKTLLSVSAAGCGDLE